MGRKEWSYVYHCYSTRSHDLTYHSNRQHLCSTKCALGVGVGEGWVKRFRDSLQSYGWSSAKNEEYVPLRRGCVYDAFS